MVRLTCPQCGTTFEPAKGVAPRCPSCGYQPGVHAPRPSGVPAPADTAWQPPTAPPGAVAQRTHPLAIVSLVSGLVPFVFGIVPPMFGGFEIFGIFGFIGPILAIVCGAVAMNQIKRDPQYKGHGLALAGLIIGIVEVALFIVALIFVLIFFSALAAACGSGASSSGSSSECAAPVALVAARRREREGWPRWLLAHHPDCEHYRNDVFRIAGFEVCAGCATTTPTGMVVVGVLAFAQLPVAWWIWVVAGLGLSLVQLVSVLGRARSRAAKVAVKLALGVGLAFTLHGIWNAPFPLWARIGLLAAGWLVGFLAMMPRARRMEAEADAHGHGIVGAKPT